MAVIGKRTGTAPLFFLMLLCGLTGCGSTMTRDTLLEQMRQGMQPLVIDVRSRAEYERDRVPGAIHVPFYSIRSGLEERKLPKDAPLVLYCEHGPRAGISSLMLYLNGYEHIYSLQGHMKGWRESDFPLETTVP